MNIADTLTRLARKIQKVYDAGYTKGAKIAESKPYIDTSRLIHFDYFCAYNRFTYEELLHLDTSNAVSFTCMFSSCTKLTSVPPLDSSNVITFSAMFNSCSKLTTIPELDTSRCSNFTKMFYDCEKLTSIPQLDISNGTTLSSMFYNCTALTDVTFTGVIPSSLDIKSSPLNKSSIISVIEHLSDTATGKTLTLKKTAVDNAFRLYAKTLDVVGTISDTIGTENFDYVIATGVYGEGVNVGEYILLHFDDVSVVLMKTGESIDVLSGLDEGQWELIEYGDGIEDEWGNLVASKSNWTINLV